MTDCPIFAAAAFMDRVWREIDHLCAAIVDGLERAGIAADYLKVEVHQDDWAEQRLAYEYALRRVYKHQRTPAQLLLYFDLARPGQASDWPGSEAAILMIAYETRLENGWTLEQLTFGNDGSFVDPLTRTASSLEASSGFKLLVWEGGEEDAWARRAWAFGIRLSHLAGPDDVEQQVTAPLLSLIQNTHKADEILRGTKALPWSMPT